MRHGNSVTIATTLLIGLLLSVVIQVWALPATVKSVIEVFPEITLLAVPAIIWGVLGYATPGAVLGLLASGLTALLITGALGLFLGTRALLPRYSYS